MIRQVIAASRPGKSRNGSGESTAQDHSSQEEVPHEVENLARLARGPAVRRHRFGGVAGARAAGRAALPNGAGSFETTSGAARNAATRAIFHRFRGRTSPGSAEGSASLGPSIRPPARRIARRRAARSRRPRARRSEPGRPETPTVDASTSSNAQVTAGRKAGGAVAATRPARSPRSRARPARPSRHGRVRPARSRTGAIPRWM